MKDELTCDVLTIHTTTVCTLKCAKCGSSFPQFRSPFLANVDLTIAAFDRLFQVYDSIRELRFGGAEAFLYPELAKLMNAAIKYKDKFQYAIVVTNGTYIPDDSILETIQNLPYPFIVRIDNYGALSKECNELISILHEKRIEVDERMYAGEDPAFGGWIDFGDYADRHYTNKQLQHTFKYCRMPGDSVTLVEDRLMTCCYAVYGYLLGKVNAPAREVVHLLDNQNIEEMQGTIKTWWEQPYEACKYCNGFDPEHSPRVPAAEQFSGNCIVSGE